MKHYPKSWKDELDKNRVKKSDNRIVVYTSPFVHHTFGVAATRLPNESISSLADKALNFIIQETTFFQDLENIEKEATKLQRQKQRVETKEKRG